MARYPVRVFECRRGDCAWRQQREDDGMPARWSVHVVPEDGYVMVDPEQVGPEGDPDKRDGKQRAADATAHGGNCPACGRPGHHVKPGEKVEGGAPIEQLSGEVGVV